LVVAHAVAAAVEPVDIANTYAVGTMNVALTLDAVFLEPVVVPPVGAPGDGTDDEQDRDELLYIDANHRPASHARLR
jgi:hypothetical protein